MISLHLLFIERDFAQKKKRVTPADKKKQWALKYYVVMGPGAVPSLLECLTNVMDEKLTQKMVSTFECIAKKAA